MLWEFVRISSHPIKCVLICQINVKAATGVAKKKINADIPNGLWSIEWNKCRRIRACEHEPLHSSFKCIFQESSSERIKEWYEYIVYFCKMCWMIYQTFQLQTHSFIHCSERCAYDTRIWQIKIGHHLIELLKHLLGILNVIWKNRLQPLVGQHNHCLIHIRSDKNLPLQIALIKLP